MNATALRYSLLRGLLLSMLISGLSQAQHTGDGSVYSRLGLGEQMSYASSQLQAMGGSGVGLFNLNYLNLDNPATWAEQVLTRATGSVLFQRLWSTDAQGQRARLGSGTLHALHLSFPLQSRRLGLALAFRPYTRANYRIRSANLLVRPELNDTVRYQIDYAGEGGLQQLNGGLGLRLTHWLSIGAQADLLFGIIEHTQRTTFSDPKLPAVQLPDHAPTLFATSTRLVGLRGTLGLLAQHHALWKSTDMLALGIVFTTPASLRATRVRTLGESLDRDTLTVPVRGKVDMPWAGALGLSYQLDNRWTFVLDGRYEPWSHFGSDLTFSGYEPNGENRFKDRWRLSFGIEYLPAGTDFSATYFHQIAYRIGGYVDRMYVDPQPNVALRTWAVTAGLSLPTMYPGTRLDLNFEVGMRGTTAYHLVRDVYYRVGLSVNVGERWFIKRRLN
ncbi:hypothetical protein [Rhodothermus bifroesti]|uniref:Membrane protein involved in aromatic hydrocarbon degradation n=1 Tax=Rhodothermus marinus TaxID=29549 RepID=A0A7V2F6B4_RHOMR|nr:hypothetical protein [Rhodothermus bifroesti]GBD00901.1 hypothetical protein HRbin18_00618 [bacterium HR18]